MSDRIYLSPPHMSESELNLLIKAFNSNWIAPLGPNVDAFEKEMADYLSVQGCLTAQLFKHITTDRILGIEINPRFGGGYPLSYYAGANYPKWIIQEYLLNQSIIPNDDWKNNLLMLCYDKEVIVKNSDA